MIVWDLIKELEKYPSNYKVYITPDYGHTIQEAAGLFVGGFKDGTVVATGECSTCEDDCSDCIFNGVEQDSIVLMGTMNEGE
jgi:hypothetical protein